jgi:hypothetical protein
MRLFPNNKTRHTQARERLDLNLNRQPMGYWDQLFSSIALLSRVEKFHAIPLHTP